mmetsp:Transcript_54770/g.74873  ORF Transcript_54770/g.74873 Transcript_54770/m.74873 type:complete len:92 (+) Transcript_54770:511-786(+)
MKPCIKMFIAADKPIPKNTTVSTNSVEDIIVPSSKRGFSAAPSAWQSETVTFSGTVGPRICVRNDLQLADEKMCMHLREIAGGIMICAPQG